VRAGKERLVRIISRRRLREFWDRHTDAERPLKTWYAIVNHQAYETAQDLKEDFASVSFLGRHRTVFNVGGNKYRLVVDMRYDLGRVYVREVLTHEEYDRRSREGTL
jgi:mRNA interferase HigB